MNNKNKNISVEDITDEELFELIEMRTRDIGKLDESINEQNDVFTDTNVKILLNKIKNNELDYFVE